MRLPEPEGVSASLMLVGIVRLDLALDADAMQMLAEAASWRGERMDDCLRRIVAKAIMFEHDDVMVEMAWRDTIRD